MISVDRINGERVQIRIKGKNNYICAELEMLITALLDDGMDEDLLVDVVANAIREHCKHKINPLQSIIDVIKEASDHYEHT